MSDRTMKAAVVRRIRQAAGDQGGTPFRKPGPGEVLVKVHACGVCHTDLHAADGDWPVKPKPCRSSRVTKASDTLRRSAPG